MLFLDSLEPAVYGIDAVLDELKFTYELIGLAIDAPLVINNITGQRECEKGIC